MEALILLASPFHYVWQRLRYVSLQRIMTIAIRWAEWLSFGNLISHKFAFAYLAFRYGLDFLIRYRWSRLEDFRKELMTLKNTKQRRLFQNVIQTEWKRTWAGLLLLLPFLLFGGIALYRFFVHDPVPLTAWVVLSLVFIHFLTDWIMRTLQSVLYTTSRVQRPFWSMSGVDALHILLLLSLARNHGPIGLVAVFFINTGLRIFLSYHFTLRTFDAVGISRLHIPKLRGLSFSLTRKSLLTGIVLPALQLSFLISTVIYYRALRELDSDENYLFLMYVVSPLFVFAGSFGFLYYVDFLKYRDRVYQKVYGMLIRDATRGLAFYTLLAFAIGYGVDRATSLGAFGAMNLLICSMILFSWGLYFLYTLIAFVKGARSSLIAIALLTALGIAASPDVELLIAFSIGFPLLGAGIALLISKSLSDLSKKEWVPKELIPSDLAIQGVTLNRSALGFSLNHTTETLLERLPEGSKISFFDRSTLLWWTPDSNRLKASELLDTFGVNWHRELNTIPKANLSPLPSGAIDWRLGESLSPHFGPIERRDAQRLWTLMRKRVSGQPRAIEKTSFGFSPRFENGVWVGGKVWKKRRGGSPETQPGQS